MTLRKTFAALALASALALTGSAAFAEETATTQPSQVSATASDFSSPRATLKTLETLQDQASVEKALTAYQASTPQEKEVARALASADAATGKLRMLAVKKFGPDSAEPITHALRDVTAHDIDAASVKINGNGNTAVVSGKYFSGPLDMVKVDGKWRIAVSKMISANGSAEGVKDVCDDFVKAVNDTISEFEQGKFVNPSLLERAISRRMWTLLGDE